jgi:putative FmdB family regulatory protein
VRGMWSGSFGPRRSRSRRCDLRTGEGEGSAVPTYDYRCNACAHTFEHFQSMKDAPLRVCAECGKRALERLIGTGAAVIFKGSGFYQTDYRSEGYKKAAAADAPQTPSTDASAGAGGSANNPGDGTKGKANSETAKGPGPGGEGSRGEATTKEKRAESKGSSPKAPRTQSARAKGGKRPGTSNRSK